MVLPRSAIKLIHVLPFLMSDAPKRFSVTQREIVLSASSHVANPEQLAALAAFADRLDIAGRALVCGPDRPLGRGGARGAQPLTAFHNNNAGKHLGVIATCLAHGEAPDGYADAAHPAQQRLLAITRDICGIAPPETFVTENCGMPTFPLPLRALAIGMARLSRPDRLPPVQELAAELLFTALTAAPDDLTGPGRLSTEIIRVTDGRVIAKGGAEGVYAGLDRRQGLGLALKIDDGSGEAASAAIVEALAAIDALSPGEAEALRRFTRFWAHPFVPERSLDVRFPFLESLRQS
jgi:L-asparaginase II